MSAIQRAPVDDLGNINIHGRSGFVAILKVETVVTNVFEDISASLLFQ